MKVLHVGVFLDHDIIIRNFIGSRAFDALAENFTVSFFFPKNVPSRVSTSIHSLPLPRVLSVHVNSQRIARLRYYARVAQIRTLRNRSQNDKTVAKEIFERFFPSRRKRWLSRIVSLSVVYPIFQRLVFFRIGENIELQSLIRTHSLDCIVHPTVLEGLFVNDLIRLGKQNGVPTLLLMNSWDNPSTKSVFSGEPNCLVVWGEQTKRHAEKYLGLKDSSIIVGGAPQFECYSKGRELDSSEYRERLGVKPGNNLICYGGSSKGIDELGHLQILDRFIGSYSLPIKILYKPHPWKDMSRDENLKGKDFFDMNYQNVLFDPFSTKRYDQGRLGASTGLMDAEIGPNNIVLRAVDGLISPASTILLEAAMLGVPIAVFNQQPASGASLHATTAGRRIQFIEFFERMAPLMCETPEQLCFALKDLLRLSKSPEYRENLVRNVSYFIETPKKPYRETLVDIVLELLSQKVPHS